MMLPWFTTVPELPGLDHLLYRPALASWSLIVSVVAKSAPTSTLALGANRTPFGLLRKTWPLAVMRPKMSDGLLPRTRLTVSEEALGWLKFTHALEPMVKLFQLIVPLSVTWSICSLVS